MVQKIIDVVGSSPKGFSAAAENAVKEAAKTVRNLRWARVTEFEAALEGEKIKEYKANLRIYFDVER